MPGPVQAKRVDESIVQRQEDEEKENEEEAELQTHPEEEEIVQPKTISSKSDPVSLAVESGIRSLRGGGQPLSESSRAYFEPSFGTDFSNVRVHTDANANHLTRSINAKAFTLGRDVVFGAGQYEPASNEGRRLLAHELTHVVQQTGAGPSLIIQRQNAGGLSKPSSVVPIPGEHEPNCPGRTNLGYREPFPPCSHTNEEIEGDIYLFCKDSDIFKTPSERARLRMRARRQPHGTKFKIHAHSSFESPGTIVNSRQYNERLSCHRAKRAARELMSVGVAERDITIESKGPTDMFGKGYSLRHLNRNVVVAMKAPQRRRQGLPEKATLRQIADAARARLVSGDYNLGADGYIYRWTCGRFKSLKDAVARTTIKVEGVDFTASITTKRPSLGSTDHFGLNTILLYDDIKDDVNPVGCAVSRIADLTFHHMARPMLPLNAEQHEGGSYMVYLGGLPGCTTGTTALSPNKNYYKPSTTDPKAGKQPYCTDIPGGPISPHRQSRGLKPAPIFQGIRIVANVGSGKLKMDRLTGSIIGMVPSQAIKVTGEVEGRGNPAELAKYEVGFLQTILKEDYMSTYVGGQRLSDRLPLPLKDGAPPGDSRYAAPWFDNSSRVTASKGSMMIRMLDHPNMRVFRAFPNLENTSFFKGYISQKPLPHVHLRSGVKLGGFAFDSQYNVPNKAHREIHFNTWLAARQAVPQAPLTRMSTDFLIGIKMVLRMDADFIVRNGNYSWKGSWRLTSKPATPADESSMLLSGAVPKQFMKRVTENKKAINIPLFNEYLTPEGSLPRAQAGGVSSSAYWNQVRRIARPYRITAAQKGPLTVKVRIENSTGRVILDSPTLRNKAITVEGRHANRIRAREAMQLARAIFPEVRKLILGYARLLPSTGISRLSFMLKPIP